MTTRTTGRWLTVNSVVCYVLAFLFTTVIHECGHAFVGSWLGSGPILHHNYVAHHGRELLPLEYQVWIALAGPLMSLLQGLIIMLIIRRYEGGSVGHLLLRWLMLLGFGNFLGYLMTGPFFSNGDLGKVEVLLGLSMTIRAAIAVVGALVLTLIAYKTTRPFLSFATEVAALESERSRMDFNRSIIILPWLIGAAVITMLYLPIIAIVSIIYPFTSGMVFIFPWKNARRIVDAQARGDASITRPALLLYAVLVITALIFRFVLAPGIVI